jgi:transposase
MNRETVKSILKKLKTSDSSLPLKGGGRPKKITKRAEQHVGRLIREDPFITYKML